MNTTITEDMNYQIQSIHEESFEYKDREITIRVFNVDGNYVIKAWVNRMLTNISLNGDVLFGKDVLIAGLKANVKAIIDSEPSILPQVIPPTE